MTNQETEELKSKIKKLMMDHLVATYGPNYTKDQVLKELKNMWTKIEENNLKAPGMNFNAFSQHAQNQFLMSDAMDIFGI